MPINLTLGDGLLLNYVFKVNPFGLSGVPDYESLGGMRPPAVDLYFSLHTAALTNDYAAALASELTGKGYGRATAPTDNTGAPYMWNNPFTNGTNQQEISLLSADGIFFPPVVGSSDWDEAVAIGVWRVPTGGAARDYILYADIDQGGTPLIANPNTQIWLKGTAGGTPVGIRFMYSNLP